MIISKTPLRISLVGGGTDMPSFYERHDGEVISMAIDKYIYVILNPKFDGRIRISYSKTEIVDEVKDIQHDIVREVMKLFQMKGMEIVSVSDIPGGGSGLGSSSTFTVGLLRAVYGMNEYRANPGSLAETAFMVESKLCGHPVGKQDHYAAAYGGINHYIFQKKKVSVNNFAFPDDVLDLLNSNLMLFWTDVTRKADDILAEQANAWKHNEDTFAKGLLMTELTHNLKQQLDHLDFKRLGKFISADWKLKRTLTNGITSTWIDNLMVGTQQAGAEGAKICGAGGGGFLLVVAQPENHERISAFLGLKRVRFKIGVQGSMLIYSEE